MGTPRGWGHPAPCYNGKKCLDRIYRAHNHRQVEKRGAMVENGGGGLGNGEGKWALTFVYSSMDIVVCPLFP